MLTPKFHDGTSLSFLAHRERFAACLAQPPQKPRSFWGRVRHAMRRDRRVMAPPRPFTPPSEPFAPEPDSPPDLYRDLGTLRARAMALGERELADSLGDLLYLHLCGSGDLPALLLRQLTLPLRQAEKAQREEIM